jgi:translocation protein SEC63
MAEGGIAGNDDSFIAFCFAIVSIIALILFLPYIFKCGKDAYQRVMLLLGMQEKKRRSRFDDDEPASPLQELVDQCLYLPEVVMYVAKHPQTVVSGAVLLKSHTALAVKVCLPQFLKFLMRPKLYVAILWALLFTSALYATLTFDAYAIMGLPNTASTSQIKKAYRQLSKVNHPDHNKTEEAKVFYPQLRKAYKSLVDTEAYEKELEKQQDFSVGIALPSFLTSHDNDGVVLFTLLGVLILLPLGCWWYFRGDSFTRLRNVQLKLTQTEAMLEGLYADLGVPKDAKHLEKRREQAEMADILVKVGLLPAEGAVEQMDAFPPLSDFKNKCLDCEHHKQHLERLGFETEGIELLKTFFTTYELAPKNVELPEASVFVPTTQPAYAAALYMIKKIHTEVEQLLEEVPKLLSLITGMPDIDLRVARKILRHHEEVLDTLDQVYRGKYAAREIKVLTEAIGKREELVREIPKEINAFMNKFRQYMYAEQMRAQKEEQGGRGGRRGQQQAQQQQRQ